MSLCLSSECASTLAPPETPLRRTASIISSARSDPFGKTLPSVTLQLSPTTKSTSQTGIPPLQQFVANAYCANSITRYSLVFATVAVANHWWKLMQQLYPDMQRESARLYQLPKDDLLSKAYDSPRFSHLKDKWTFQQTDTKDNHVFDRRSIESTRSSQRNTLRKMLSTPALRSKDSFSRPVREHESFRSHGESDDPFGIPTPPQSVASDVDFAELNKMLERMQMMMNQTQLRIDVIAERQQAYMEGMERLQSVLEANSTQIQALATQQQLGELAMKNVRSAVEQNAGHVRVMLDRSLNEADRQLDMQSKVHSCAQRVDEIADMTRERDVDLRESRKVQQRLDETIQGILSGQTIASQKVDTLQASLDQVSDQLPDPDLSRMEAAIGEQSTQISSLAAGQKTASKRATKQMTALSDTLLATFDTMLNERVTALQSSHEKKLKQLRREMTALLTSQLSAATAAQAAQHDAFIAQLSQLKCDHDVAPPPRKMNRELPGYWYKRS